MTTLITIEIETDQDDPHEDARGLVAQLTGKCPECAYEIEHGEPGPYDKHACDFEVIDIKVVEVRKR